MRSTSHAAQELPVRWTALATALALAIGAAPARSANWFVETGVRTEVTATDNASFDDRGQRSEDVILALTPTLTIRGEGRRLRLAGAAALTAVTYANGSEESAFTPTGSFTANLEAIERWLFLDAGLSSSRSLDNPLGPRPDGTSTLNRATTTSARFSPYIQRDLPNDFRLLIRSDNSWTETRGDADGRDERVYTTRHAVSFGREPRPFGVTLEAQRSDERVQGGTDRAPAVDIARLRLSYAVTTQLAVGARGGYERSDAFVEGDARSFAGAELTWRPTERTRLEGFWEDRSFGDGYQATFTHRSPRIVWDFRLSRDLTTFGDAFIDIPATNDLAALLDAALRTRITDPIERTRAVEDFLIRRGLPRSLPGAITLFSDQLLVQTARRGTITLLGLRSTLALSGFYQRDASPTGSSFSLIAGPLRDTTQQGASLTYSLRMSSLSSLLGSAGWSRTRDNAGSVAPGAVAGDDSRQWTYRMQIDYRLAPRTNGFVGGRYQSFDSTLLNDARERAIFAGLAHRF